MTSIAPLDPATATGRQREQRDAHVPSILMVLTVLTGARSWTLADGTQHPTGFWAEEFTVQHRVFTDAGAEVTIATLGGGSAIADELSLALAMNGNDPSKVEELRNYLDRCRGALASPLALSHVTPDEFDAVFTPGGNGPMQDLSVDTDRKSTRL